jgi:hypothetical protein
MKYTHDPLGWEAWIEERFPGRLGMLKAKALSGVKGLDYEELCRLFKAAIGLTDGGEP